MASRIYTITKADMKLWLESHDDIKELYKFVNLRYAGGNHKTIYKYMEKNQLLNEYQEFKERGLKTGHKKTGKATSFDKDKIFCINSPVSRKCLKRCYLKFRDNKCDNCGLVGYWNGQPITLQIHHINGVHNDNRLDNLQLLCPNCHSQTENYRGKNIK